MARLTERLDMTIVVDWDVQPQNKQTKCAKQYMYPYCGTYNIKTLFLPFLTCVGYTVYIIDSVPQN